MVGVVKVGITLAKSVIASAKLGSTTGGVTGGAAVKDELEVEAYASTCSLIFSTLFLSLFYGRSLIMAFCFDVVALCLVSYISNNLLIPQQIVSKSTEFISYARILSFDTLSGYLPEIQ